MEIDNKKIESIAYSCSMILDAYKPNEEELELILKKIPEVWKSPERMCHVVSYISDFATGETKYKCSACDYETDLDMWTNIYKHCPKCKARVISVSGVDMAKSKVKCPDCGCRDAEILDYDVDEYKLYEYLCCDFCSCDYTVSYIPVEIKKEDY